MKAIVNLQKQLVPDLLQVLEVRFAILQSVSLFHPIGRRALSENVGLTERQVRSEVDFLQEQGLLEITSKGMYVTKEGKRLLEELTDFMGELKGIHVLRERLKEKLSLDKVIIVPGNSDGQEWVKQEMGKACIAYLKSIITANNTIAVTGGSTIAAVADVMTPLNKEEDYLFVPARGALGEKVENQATRIAEEMAKKSRGNYSLLYVPDPLSEAAYKSLMEEPSIQAIVSKIKQADIVLHGVGDALKMANRRKTPQHILDKLKENEAISEAFGYYFDQDGNTVYRVRTVGLHLHDLNEIGHVVTIAGGQSKAKAIASYFEAGKSDLLITDEACAREILEG
ncbi:sugar-binding transcriptional regulator [Oceanobacillus indicireducens]|uniref:Central glycolytic genes regulator n=1 Tax=Oceanobacillus indicireducens TaxID=1004261 RepID=A0A918D4F6_9BACI|nr:sugar-binding domain-containing protein [Oceanobacillus indicireducens]GGN64668.1 central glycolytic genes regulator [Oceanobacillus indicireducens]